MIAGSKAAAKTEQEAKKVREADPFDVFQDIIHISPAQPVLFEGGSFCILLSDEERLSLTFEGTPSKKTPSKKTYREEVHSKASGEKTYSGELLTFYADDRFTVSSESSFGLLRLRPEAVLSLTGRIRLFRNILSDYNAAAILHIRQGFEELLDMTEGSSFVSGRLGKTSCVLRILQLLIDAGLPDESVPEPLVPLSPRRLALYRSLAACIRERGTNRIHQAEAAELLGITPQYLGHFVKEATGMTFREFSLALNEERKLLISSFQKDEIRPGAGRQASFSGDEVPALPAYPGDEVPALPAYPDRGGYRTAAGSEAPPFRSTGVYAKINPVHELPLFFRRLINLGYAANLRNLDLDSALNRIQKEIGFTFGRICRITDLIRSGTVCGQSYYDFSPVFALLDSLIAHNMTPFLELGNKSFLIQETTTLSYTPVSPTDTREYYTQLLIILPEFAKACINHYGQARFDEWYFEISYMYTDDAARERFGLVQYASMFRKIYSVLRSFSPSCRIGGPGFNDWSDPARIRQMVKLMSSQDFTPDFYSAYIYPVVKDSQGSLSISEDPDTGISRIRAFAETVRSADADRELWITEFNSNLSSRSFLNDSPYQAVYIVRMMAGALQLGISALGYYLLSDAPLRYLDSLDFLFGGWGLLSDRGIPKPSFHAYRMLDMLGHYLIRSSENCIITANSRGSFQLLVFRYRHPGGVWLHSNVTKEDLALPQAVFGQSGADRFRISVEDVLKGTYLVKEYRIADGHADLYSAWRSLDFLYPPNAVTLQELALKSALVPRIRVCRLSEGEPFVTEMTLSGTELRFVSVELYTSHT